MPKKPQQEPQVKASSFGDMFVLYAKRTGFAHGHIATSIDGAKRIDWIRQYAAEQQTTVSKAIRALLNQSIDKKMRATGRKE